MGSNELGIRFTEEKYATKNEVAKELRITAIDSFWANILTYRAQFKRYLNLKTIDRELFSLCCCSSINALISNTENKLLVLNREFMKIYSNPSALKNVTDSIFNKIGTTTNLLNYSDVMRYAYSAYANANNGEDYLADIFSRVNNVTEITHFYRTDDSVTKEKTALVDRIYKCAPSVLIEPMMNDLFLFVNDKSLSAIAKFALIYFYMIYVRPFDVNYKEIAMIYAKSVLANDSLGELAFLIPFEDIIFDDMMLDTMVAETQKALDLTYFVKYFLETLMDSIDIYINRFRNMTSEPAPAPVAPAPTPVVAPVPTPRVVPTPKPAPVVQQAYEPVAPQPQPVYVARANVTISEKESATILNKIENELLQKDPNLKKKEAHFYSRHRELGKCYAIADYKKFSRCVYETARTSMDHLAELGYYKKKQIKNKFVYETIER